MIVKDINIGYPGFGNIVLREGYSEHENWYPAAEKQSKTWWANNIQHDWNILDIGANIGMYSALFSKLVPHGKVYCFEPTPTIEILKRNLEHIGTTNCECLNYAIGNKVGALRDKVQMIWKHKVLDQHFNFMTVDKFVSDRNLKIDAIKIDVDGYDPEVLYGAKCTLLQQSPMVVVELNPEALGYRGHKPHEAIGFMETIGYFLVDIMDRENYLFAKK